MSVNHKPECFFVQMNGLNAKSEMISSNKERLAESWNTRKPMERIVERLEQQAKQYNRRANELVEKSTEAGIHNKGKACSYEHAIEIVKEEGGMNDHRKSNQAVKQRI